MIKSKLSQNFSFKPLQKNLDKIINEAYEDLGKTYVFNLKDTLIKESYNPKPLTKLRVKNRAKGIWFPDSVRGSQYIPKPTNMTKPLVQTENLLNSIEVKKDGIYMARYGKVHNDGSEGMPRRPFIDFAIQKSKTQIKEVQKKLFFKAAKLLKKGRVTEL